MSNLFKTSPVLLKRFEVEGFRNFKKFSGINIAAINVFVGPNGSGKSTLLRLLRLFHEQRRKGEVDHISIADIDSYDLVTWQREPFTIRVFERTAWDGDHFVLEKEYCYDVCQETGSWVLKCKRIKIDGERIFEITEVTAYRSQSAAESHERFDEVKMPTVTKPGVINWLLKCQRAGPFDAFRSGTNLPSRQGDASMSLEKHLESVFSDSMPGVERYMQDSEALLDCALAVLEFIHSNWGVLFWFGDLGAPDFVLWYGASYSNSPPSLKVLKLLADDKLVENMHTRGPMRAEPYLDDLFREYGMEDLPKKPSIHEFVLFVIQCMCMLDQEGVNSVLNHNDFTECPGRLSWIKLLSTEDGALNENRCVWIANALRKMAATIVDFVECGEQESSEGLLKLNCFNRSGRVRREGLGDAYYRLVDPWDPEKSIESLRSLSASDFDRQIDVFERGKGSSVRASILQNLPARDKGESVGEGAAVKGRVWSVTSDVLPGKINVYYSHSDGQLSIEYLTHGESDPLHISQLSRGQQRLILIELMQGSYFCFEEPETGLHPKYQSLLAKAVVSGILEACEDEPSGVGLRSMQSIVFIETHSEYFVRALQLEARNMYKSAGDGEAIREAEHFEVTYFQKDDDAAHCTLRPMGLRRDGMLKASFGPGFFDETFRLTSLLLSNNHN